MRHNLRMPRTARHAPPGFAYHVLNRGVGRMQLFSKPADYQAFVEIVGETLAKIPLPIMAFALMPNHWHFVVRPQQRDQLAQFFSG
jgi:putative transposase